MSICWLKPDISSQRQMTVKTNFTKRPILIAASVLLILLHVIVFTSCDFDESKNNFRGGELLDAEKMSEIKNELLGTESETEKGNGSQISGEYESNSGENSEGTQRDTVGTERNETESNNFAGDTAIIVYWTEGGSVWHISRDCYHIKNKDVISGTVAEAEKSGHDKGCKTCNKNPS